ncbi:glycosyltransferase family 2 protein [Nocardioides antri]|uniref:Glycosyltransferase n=1 Tax=Nocardioides antri TaxID=2607659 RepID=A0A5B1M0X2_9ACTN|nr:glycosyltransferase family 2 protein [Nocardioides antri]KAA1426401.1 glycosyltransferase [Nocardioides antri]
MPSHAQDEAQTDTSPRRLLLLRVVTVLSLLAGTVYLTWRWGWSVNWEHWWIAVPLVLAETYALLDGYLFGITIWRVKRRGAAPPPSPDATVDVLITTYNEPVEMVTATARAALAIEWPHTTYILDDGARPEMRAAAEAIGVGYLTRSDDWDDRPRHAKAGNLNNALLQTYGEFLLILDADQIPKPEILHRTLGWFQDPEMALVQTPQWFSNVSDSDPLGSQAPLFYGPIQQGKDGWNAAFFCGSNAVIRREALMRLGITGYVSAVESAVRSALDASGRILARAARRARKEDADTATAVRKVHEGVRKARADLDAGAPYADVTYRFQQTVREASRSLVDRDLAAIRADLAELGLDHDVGISLDPGSGIPVVRDDVLEELTTRDLSPLSALEEVSRIMRAVDVTRADEAQPVMPVATVSVTEDMATCMQLHAAGWKSAYHHEVLATGLAPEDLGTMLKQRLRWAQGTLQVLLKDNPLTKKGLTAGQRLMYFATMWSYLSGFAALAFLLAPVFYLVFGVLPVHAYGLTFLALFTPYFLLNQLEFLIVGYGVKTWRGHQYSLALFPLWIKACTTAAANVWFGRELGFMVTPKVREGGPHRFPFRLIWPQLLVMVLLVVAVVAGVVQLLTGNNLTVIGVGVNTLWVGYDLLVLSVIIQAGLYRPADHDPSDEQNDEELVS